MAEVKVDPKKAEGLMDKIKTLIMEFGGKKTFAEVKLKDGTVIYYEGDMPVEGLEVWVIPSDGTEKLPAPDGVHVLEDGSQLEVVAGKITKVVPMEEMKKAETAPTLPETEAAAKRIVESTIKETVFSKEEVTSEIKKATDAFAAQFEAHKKETDKAIETFASANEALTKALGTALAETETVKNQFSKFSTDTLAILAEFGGQPQKKEEKKAAEFQAEKTDVKKALSDAEFKKRYQN